MLHPQLFRAGAGCVLVIWALLLPLSIDRACCSGSSKNADQSEEEKMVPQLVKYFESLGQIELPEIIHYAGKSSEPRFSADESDKPSKTALYKQGVDPQRSPLQDKIDQFSRVSEQFDDFKQAKPEEPLLSPNSVTEALDRGKISNSDSNHYDYQRDQILTDKKRVEVLSEALRERDELLREVQLKFAQSNNIYEEALKHVEARFESKMSSLQQQFENNQRRLELRESEIASLLKKLQDQNVQQNGKSEQSNVDTKRRLFNQQEADLANLSFKPVLVEKNGDIKKNNQFSELRRQFEQKTSTPQNQMKEFNEDNGRRGNQNQLVSLKRLIDKCTSEQKISETTLQERNDVIANLKNQIDELRSNDRERKLWNLTKNLADYDANKKDLDKLLEIQRLLADKEATINNFKTRASSGDESLLRKSLELEIAEKDDRILQALKYNTNNPELQGNKAKTKFNGNFQQVETTVRKFEDLGSKPDTQQLASTDGTTANSKKKGRVQGIISRFKLNQ